MPKYNIIHTNLPVAVADDSDSQRLLVGIVVDDSFVPFGAVAPYFLDEAVADETNTVSGEQPATPPPSPETPPAS